VFKNNLLIYLLFGVAIFTILYLTTVKSNSFSQPIQFSHLKHKEQGLECDTCHTYFSSQKIAGIPNIDICMQCHSEAITESREEEKIREYSQKGELIPWQRMYSLPSHVYFSHSRHVGTGKLSCADCHGNIGELNSPPEEPPKKISMKNCMKCHELKRVKNDCIFCHV